MTLTCETDSMEAQAAVLNYCARLNSVLDTNCPEDLRQLKSVTEFRRQRPDKFNELARIHLSFLIDLPHFEVDGGGGGGCVRRLRKRPQLQLPILSAKRGRQSRAASTAAASPFGSSISYSSTSSGLHSSVSQASADRICQLIGHLEHSNRYTAEGIFRKTGSCSRQKELRRQLLNSCSSSISNYTVHDVANVIKQLLRGLDEPLLSDRLCDVFAAVAELNSPRHNDKGGLCQRNQLEQQIVTCRQVKAVRILLLLLPALNANLLKRLLSLLHRVAVSPETRMNADNLGKVFGPVLFSAKALETAALQRRVDKLNEISAFLIEHCHRLNEMPRSFANDLVLNAARLNSAASGVGNDKDNVGNGNSNNNDYDDDVTTTVRFSESGGRVVETDYGRRQLQQLLNHISRLPDSKEKRRFEKRLGQHAVCCTPDRLCSFRKRLNAARSFGRLANCVDSVEHPYRGCHADSSESPAACGGVSRFSRRDRRLLRALSSIRIYKSQRRQQRHQLEQLRARLCFDAADDEEEEAATATTTVTTLSRRSKSVSSPKLVFTDAADVDSPSPSRRQLSCSTIFESPTATTCQELLTENGHFLETAL